MPSLSKVAKLRNHITDAPKRNRERINNIIKLYEDAKIPNYRTVGNVILKLTYPSFHKPGEAEKDYHTIITKYQNAEPITGRLKREVDDNKRKRDAPKTEFALTVILYTNERSKHTEGNTLTDEQKKKYKKYLRKDFKDLKQFWVGQITVKGGSIEFFDSIKWKLTKKDPNDRVWKKLFHICMTDESFESREKIAPGYVDGVYLLNYEHHGNVEPNDPAVVPKRSGENIAIQYKYCAHQADLSKSTFKEAIEKNHYTKAECWINALFDHYHDSLLRTNKNRSVITREIIIETLGRTEEDIKEGLTVEDVLPFFKKYRLSLRVFDVFYKCIFRYDPDVPNKHEVKFYCMTDGDHVYTLNHDLERLHQKIDEQDDFQVYASKDFRTPKDNKDDDREVNHLMIEHIDDILSILKEAEGNDDKKKGLIYLVHKYDDLEEVLWQLNDAGFKPQVKFEAGRLTFIFLTINSTTFLLKTQRLVHTEIDGLIEVDTAEKYNKAYEANATFTGRLLRRDLKSYYTQEDMNILDEYRTVANIGWLKDIRPGAIGKKDTIQQSDLVEIDVSKAYTAAFMKITQIPIFSEFDNFKAYHGEEIKDLSLYIVQVDVVDMVFNKKFNLCYGMFLKKLPCDTVKILWCKTPSFIKKVEFKDIVDELFATELSPDIAEDMLLKKQIANTGYGMLEKGINKHQKSYLFDTYADAKHYQIKYGGTINFINQYEEKESYYINPLDIGIEDIEPTLQTDFVETGKVIYILNLSAKASMTNGFRYIKELLVQHHNVLMSESLKKLNQHGITTYSVKTDALTIHRKDLPKAKKILAFGKNRVLEASAIIKEGFSNIKTFDITSIDRIIELSGVAEKALRSMQPGTWRVSKTEDIIFPYDMFQLKENREMNITEPVVNNIELTVQDEYDTGKLCEHFEHYKRVMVRAEFAGCGKSYACKYMERRGHKVLFVCPTNKLASNYGENGITLNRFFSIAFCEDAKMAKFDDSPYNVIVFDEICFADVRKLARIKRYCDEHPDKIIIATGDTNQLETIDRISDQLDYDEYSNHCINMIFPNLMYFRENKRLKSDEDKRILKQVKEDLFNEDIPVIKTLKKYFKFTDKVDTTYNIAFKNKTCDVVGKQVRKMLKKRNDYEVGELLVCRKWFKWSKNTFQVNYEYLITKVGKTTITLDDKFEVPLSMIQKNFTYNYCRTCHSFQGSSIDEKITIFDWNFWHVNRKWLYTAITRATELKNVVFYNYTEDVKEKYWLDAYLKKKIDGYVAQDIAAGRLVGQSKYITKGWLKDCFGKSCQHCGDCLMYECDENYRITSNLTAQRINNSLPHNDDNIVPFCVHCNCSMSNREY